MEIPVNRHQFCLAVLVSALAFTHVAAQPPRDDPLGKAEEILNTVKSLQPLDLAVNQLEPPAANILAGRRGKGTINVRAIFFEFGMDGETVSAWTQAIKT